MSESILRSYSNFGSYPIYSWSLQAKYDENLSSLNQSFERRFEELLKLHDAKTTKHGNI